MNIRDGIFDLVVFFKLWFKFISVVYDLVFLFMLLSMVFIFLEVNIYFVIMEMNIK